MLPMHDRYAFRAITDRAFFRWPNGAGLAIYVAINVEQFPFGEGRGVPLYAPAPPPDVVNFSWRDWGNRVGVWRLIELFENYSVPLTILLNSEIYDHCAPVAAAFRARGDEFVGHGTTNGILQTELAEDEERRFIAACTERIQHEEGAAPRGWMGPAMSESFVTPDLVAEAGYDYILDWAADDQPIRLKTRSGHDLLAVPYVRPTNDMPNFGHRYVTPSDWADMTIDQIEEMIGQSTKQAIVFNLSLHTFLTGHAFRLRHLRRVVGHIAELAEDNAIWLARAGDVAAYCRTLPDGVIA
jgi:peptidoglycan/xylan/chitin deacetylase (PgdA/CDA1 family)